MQSAPPPPPPRRAPHKRDARRVVFKRLVGARDSGGVVRIVPDGVIEELKIRMTRGTPGMLALLKTAHASQPKMPLRASWCARKSGASALVATA